MDNREEMTPVQPESGVRYTIDEFLTLMEPQHREDQETTRQCIAGLTGYATQLAAKGQEEQVPRLRDLCIEMAEFWGLAEDDTWEGFRKMEEQYGGAFDSAVSAARESGQAPDLSEQARQNILDGLELYAQEMRLNEGLGASGQEVSLEDGLGQWIVECELLSEQLQAEWQAEAQANMEMGGM
ncbi:hypothetical protein D1646_03830 [Pseudoflavonifractor sp. 60]|uniref:hypothetical protein n=1 Tax=Pseudoflavonifractor sp. 60 TaxID=2304576 RepID=UPI001371BD39|nr:hypothetical protein [Pseudoflavonifractor sp. 60]NBI65953.1 hypothetical protein [Pseudoflavonifractor sp. 60]